MALEDACLFLPKTCMDWHEKHGIEKDGKMRLQYMGRVAPKTLMGGITDGQ